MFPAYAPGRFGQYPTEAAYRAAPQRGTDNRYRDRDLGETTPDVADGTFSFKTDLGAEPVPTLRWEWIGPPVGRVSIDPGAAACPTYLLASVR